METKLPRHPSITGATWAELKAKADSHGRISLRELLPCWNAAARAAYEAGQHIGALDGRIDQLTEIQELLKRGFRLTA